MPIRPEREYRSMELLTKQEQADNEYIVEGYATTFGDSYELYRDGKYVVMETIDKEAFRNADLSDVVFLINHSGRVYARTRNNSIELVNDEHGLRQKTNLGLTSSSRSVYEDIDAGLYDRMSFAFTVAKDTYTEEERANGDIILTRTILEVGKVYDISVVDFPANPYTDISARSKDSIDGEIKRFEAERLHAQEINEKRQALKEQISRILEVTSNE